PAVPGRGRHPRRRRLRARGGGEPVAFAGGRGRRPGAGASGRHRRRYSSAERDRGRARGAHVVGAPAMPPESLADDEALASAWEEAAVDLGIRVAQRKRIGLGDREATVAALVHDFGSDNGMVVTGRGDYRGVVKSAGEAGYGY